jgi:flavin-binding protein dodecin
MEIIPIKDLRWCDAQNEMVDTGGVIGYQALSPSGAIIGSGETVADAIEEALQATWLNHETA